MINSIRFGWFFATLPYFQIPPYIISFFYTADILSAYAYISR